MHQPRHGARGQAADFLEFNELQNYIYIYTPYTLWQYLTKYKAIQDFESNGMDLERNLHVVLWATIVGWCV